MLRVVSVALFEQLKELNERRIEVETHASCVSLYLKDKEAASLNPVCINSFKNRFHPELTVDPMIEAFINLQEEEEQAILQAEKEVAELQAAIRKDEKKVDQQAPDFESVMAMKCD